VGNSPRIEHSRRHGPFDPRYPTIRHEPAPASLWQLGEERLQWRGFLARFFPDSGRHDFDALASYQSYVTDAGARPADGVRPETDERSDEQEEPAATGDTERWEGDGGASAARPRRRRGERPVGTHEVEQRRNATARPEVELNHVRTNDSSPYEYSLPRTVPGGKPAQDDGRW
jgi:hypothetical protein